MMLSMRLGRGIRVYGIWLLFGLSACLGAQNPKAKKHLDEAFMAFNAAEFPKALSSVNKALKADPKYADAFSLQASVYEAMRDTAHATESYRNCLRVAPEFQPM